MIVNIVIGVTVLVLLSMITSPYWGWKFIGAFRDVKKVHERLGSENINANGAPLRDFVLVENRGDKIVIYHHLKEAISDFLGSTSRSGAQTLILFALIIAVIVILFTGGLATDDGAPTWAWTSRIALIVGATDVFATLLFWRDLIFVIREVRRYSRTLEYLQGR